MSDLRGASRLAVNAVTGITDLVKALHSAIAKKYTRFAGPIVGEAINGVTDAVYKSIGDVTRGIGAGLDRALEAIGPVLHRLDSSPTREALVAALNGVLGDYLAKSENSLAISMHLRRRGQPLELNREALAASIGEPSTKVVVLVHGLCMNDLRWTRKGHDHGASLERDLSFTAVYLHYNSGLHVSTNGREFANMLDALAAAWPVPLAEVCVIAHSMGGLVARSAHHYASKAGYGWPRKLRAMVFLGTPHDGVPLARVGQWLERLWDKTPYTAPFARLGKLRSSGIADLRHGYLRDEDWQGRDRLAEECAPRAPLALPEGVECFAIAATLAHARAPLRERLIGDGLVPVPSALGQCREPGFTLAFPASHQRIVYGVSHLDLLSRAVVYSQIRQWLGWTP
ncbi:MAG TPA: hypothetical protein VGE92_09405 [Steroidobacteraceae bacterium]